MRYSGVVLPTTSVCCVMRISQLGGGGGGGRDTGFGCRYVLRMTGEWKGWGFIYDDGGDGAYAI